MSVSRFTRGEIEAGRKLFAADWQFACAAASIASLPPMRGVEIAFAGRSNVGKSSLINALTGRHALARTSHTPGRTQELIFFTGPAHARARRHAGLWLCGGREGQGQGLDRADPRLPAGPRQPGAGLPADRRPPRPEGRPTTTCSTTLDKAAVNYQVVLTKADEVKDRPADSRGAASASTAHRACAQRPAAHPDVLRDLRRATRRRHPRTARRYRPPR